ncbi:MAG TPA: DUF4249 family protein [Bacteroidales bacterium]|nr:DUF4249 family protein [Bacteroidales bacterium]
MRKLLVIIPVILIHCSCRELVTDEFREFDPVPTVNSILIAGKPLKVQVSLAEKLDTNKLTLAVNSEISLYIDGSYVEKLLPDSSGLFFSSSVVEPLRTYSLDVKVPGHETIICSESLPSPSPILNIVHTSRAGKDEEGVVYPSVSVTFKTNPTAKQFYELVVWALHERYKQAIYLEKITDPVLQNEGLPLTIFSNEIIRDSIYTMTINYFTGGASAGTNIPWHTDLYPLIIELRSCTSSYYKFVKQKYLYETGLDFDILSTSANAFQLFSNIPGGYGIFAGYSVVASDTLFPVF